MRTFGLEAGIGEIGCLCLCFPDLQLGFLECDLVSGFDAWDQGLYLKVLLLLLFLFVTRAHSQLIDSQTVYWQ
jgi:hypothetical protein